jgi:uncharacterized phage protein (TIGR02220 family)
MNYYRRYVGDYLRDTSRLSMIEHGAYNLLLDYYYADERPLPLDHQELYTMVRAMRPEDRKAVDKVLGLFFRQEPDGYHQKRVDHEIAVSKTARSNGKGGGRPRTGTITGLETGLETIEVTGTETETITGSGHPPTTNLQPPASNHQPPGKGYVGKPDVLASGILDFLNEKTGRSYKPVKANLNLITARLREGATEDDLRAVIAKKCREWLGDEKMADYLRPATLFNATKFAQYQGELGTATLSGDALETYT